jgi:hypothetical protein
MNTQKPIVFFSSDRNPFYSDFAPYVKKAWESFGFEVYYSIIDEEYNFAKPEIIPYGNQSQICRVLLPALYPDRICITADIDMLPLSKDYFLNSLSALSNKEDNIILSLSSDAYSNLDSKTFKRHPICYLAGFGQTFSKVTKTTNKKQMDDVMLEWWKKGYKWDTDEMCFSLDLYKSISNNEVVLKELSRGWSNGIANLRIDRARWAYDLNELQKNSYIDSHMLRPLSSFEQKLLPLFRSISII